MRIIFDPMLLNLYIDRKVGSGITKVNYEKRVELYLLCYLYGHGGNILILSLKK